MAPKGRPQDYTKRNVNYGRQFTKTINGKKRKVMYRYLNKDKRTKTLVFASTKKLVTYSRFQSSGMK